MNDTLNLEIQSVLRGEVFDILREKIGNPPYTAETIRRAINFSWDEALQCVTKYGFPNGSYVKGASGADGIHLEMHEGKWEVYFQDKGVKSLRFTSSDSAEIREGLLGLMIYTSGLLGPIEFSSGFYLPDTKEKFGS